MKGYTSMEELSLSPREPLSGPLSPKTSLYSSEPNPTGGSTPRDTHALPVLEMSVPKIHGLGSLSRF